jgi:hypothetical protein
MTLHYEFRVLKFQFLDNVLMPVSLLSRSNTSVTLSPSANPNPQHLDPEPSFTRFKPTGLILERPPSPAEIPKGTIQPHLGHHFEQIETEPPQIDQLIIKTEKVDPDELQIIKHPAKKTTCLKPSKQKG